MNNLIIREYQQAIKGHNKSKNHNLAENISIDIFHEDITEYLRKLNAAVLGRYELDDYDLQVISIALDQITD